MTDLSRLAADRVRMRGVQGPMEATVVTAPADRDTMLRVEVDAQPGAERLCPWPPRADRMPAAGDGALVVESDAGELWCIAWWPSAAGA